MSLNKNCVWKDKKELSKLTIHALKELGEIAEVIIKEDRIDPWKNELADLCGLCIKPMLELAKMNFDEACNIGIDRKIKKIQSINNELSRCLCCNKVLDECTCKTYRDKNKEIGFISIPNKYGQ